MSVYMIIESKVKDPKSTASTSPRCRTSWLNMAAAVLCVAAVSPALWADGNLSG